MCTEHRNITWTLMLLFLSSVPFSKEQVEYPQQHICAVKGSSVVIHCSFFCPETAKVQSVKWGHERSNIYTGPFIFDSESNTSSSRFQYIGDNIHNCSFKIHQVEHDDGGKYAFRFTYRDKNKMDAFTGNVGSVLTVADLKVLVAKRNGNSTNKEGDYVNLTCINSCDGDGLSSAFLWFKNEEPVNDGPVLYLNNMSYTDSGNYTCSLKTHKGTTSGVINIDVEYGPKNTSVSVRPSAEVDAGSNITLICTSKANPPVETYTWFKMNDHNIMNIGKEAELHFRKIFHHDGGQYYCKASNKHGSEKSSLVTLKIKAYSSIRSGLIIAPIAVLMIVVTVFSIRRFHRTRVPEPTPELTPEPTPEPTPELTPEPTPELTPETAEHDSIYVNWAKFENRQSQEENLHEEATAELIYTTIDFNSKTKPNMLKQIGDQDVIYSTVCRDQNVNPL